MGQITNRFLNQMFSYSKVGGYSLGWFLSLGNIKKQKLIFQFLKIIFKKILSIYSNVKSVGLSADGDKAKEVNEKTAGNISWFSLLVLGNIVLNLSQA